MMVVGFCWPLGVCKQGRMMVVAVKRNEKGAAAEKRVTAKDPPLYPRFEDTECLLHIGIQNSLVGKPATFLCTVVS